MLVLVAYASIEGHTGDIARRVAETIESEGSQATLVNLTQPGFAVPGRFDAVILCGPIHMGSYPHALVDFVENWKAALKDVPAALVSVSLAINSSDAEEREEAAAYPEQITDATGWKPDQIHHAAGALKYLEYNFFKRWIMRRIASAEDGPVDTSKDHVLTDWAALEAFVKSFLSETQKTAA